VALHEPVGGVVVAGADNAGPGHVGAGRRGGRGAVLLPGREGTHVVVVLVVAPGGVGDHGNEELLEHNLCQLHQLRTTTPSAEATMAMIKTQMN